MIRGFRASFVPCFLGLFFSLFPPFLCRILSGCHRSSLLGEFFCFIFFFSFSCWGFVPRAGLKAHAVETYNCSLPSVINLIRSLLKRLTHFYPTPSFSRCSDPSFMVLLISVSLPVLSLMNYPNRSHACIHRLLVDISFLLGHNTFSPYHHFLYATRASLSNGLCSSWDTPSIGVI